jgi:uncharacterized protein (TIGR02246 family)
MRIATSTNDEAQIRECLDKWTRALRAKDLDALMSLYAPDVVTFDLMPPSQVDGADRYRKNFEGWFASMPGPIDYEMHAVRIMIDGGVAFCHSVNRVTGTRATGDAADYWVRVTVGFQRRNGNWMVVHDHISMPFDMESMKAVPDRRQ